MGVMLFTPAPMPFNEVARSKAALASRLLSHVDDSSLKRIVDDAHDAFNKASCWIIVMVGETQHVIASSDGRHGLYQRSTSLCSYAVGEPSKPFVVLDAANDERFAGNPFVEDGYIRFYAGIAVLDRQGYAIGALCVHDRMPRQAFTPADEYMLQGFAKRVTTLI